MKHLIIAIALVSCLGTKLVAQSNLDPYLKLIKANSIYSADFSLKVSDVKDSQVIKGNAVVTEGYQYMQLESSEIFTFKGFSVKVVNDDKKYLYTKVSDTDVSFQHMSIAMLENYYYLNQPVKTEKGYTFTLIPIDGYAPIIGKTFILTNASFEIYSYETTVPQANYLNEITLKYTFSNRKSKIDNQKNPFNYFEIKENVVKPLKEGKYQSYTPVI